MLESLARFSFRHKWLMLFFWMLILGATVYFSINEGGKYVNNFSLPGTETQRTVDLLEESFPAQAGDVGQIVFKAEDGINAVRQRMEAGFAAAQKTSDHILTINSPYAPQGFRQVAAAGPDAGKIAFAEIQFDVAANLLPEELSDEIQEAVNEAVNPDDKLQVEYGGFAFQEIAPPGGREEQIGLAAAVLILLIAFGSVLAMGLSMFTALFSLGISLSGLAILARFMDVVTFAPLLAAMIGLGVGIDYALFIVTRYRQGLHNGKSPEAATIIAINTAGRAVLFAGCTVIISLMGMFLMGLSFMNGLAVGSGIAVLVAMLASITVLPALMGVVGRHIDRLSIHPRRKGKPAKPKERALAYRWSRKVQRHPVLFAILSLIVLGTLAAPVASLRLGNQDAGNGPTALTTRRAYDLLTEAFGPGYNGPLLVAASFQAPESFQDLQRLAGHLAGDFGVAYVTPVIPNDPANPTAAIIQVYGKYAPQDIENDDLVKHLRGDIIAPFARSTGIVVHAGGPAAVGIDLTEKLTERLPIFFGGVILLSFLLLMAAFRSILVPLKAAIMNLIAIAAAFGVLVAVFQWGWGAELIGVDRTGPIQSFSPMLLFAILFGLSMDYEVFLLSRIKEEHERTGNNAQAVADGLAQTARVITAAAAIMVTVFFSFVLGDEPNAKLVGLGLAVAVLIDATLVRMVLVPATMELLGEANWWLPRWLDRILPKIKIEADVEDEATVEPTRQGVAALLETNAEEKVRVGVVPAAAEREPVLGTRTYRTITPESPAQPANPPYRTIKPESPAAPAYAAYQPSSAPPPPDGFTDDEQVAEPSSPMGAGNGQGGDDLPGLLWDLPFKAGKGTVKENLEELLKAAFSYHLSGANQTLDVSRISGYLELEQRFGRVRQSTDPDQAAQLLVGALATPARTDEEHNEFAAAAVKIVLDGIKP
ncbi:MAG: MMPL family transporter [Actinomycetota bacterium]